MEKKEFKVGEVFHLGFHKVKVVESSVYNNCRTCIMNEYNMCSKIEYICGSCYASEREDETDVVFVKVKE